VYYSVSWVVLMAHNQVPEEVEVYVRVAGFLVMKLKVGEILRYLVWYEQGHRPLYVKCPECGGTSVLRVECGQEDSLWKGLLMANCPHPNQVSFHLHLDENAFPLQDYWLVCALREVYRHRNDDLEFKTSKLVDRKITEFSDENSRGNMT